MDPCPLWLQRSRSYLYLGDTFYPNRSWSRIRGQNQVKEGTVPGFVVALVLLELKDWKPAPARIRPVGFLWHFTGHGSLLTLSPRAEGPTLTIEECGFSVFSWNKFLLLPYCLGLEFMPHWSNFCHVLSDILWDLPTGCNRLAANPDHKALYLE